jgi:hypothetical protein
MAGLQRLGPRIDATLRGHLRAAVRRKIIGANGNEVWLETPRMDSYEQQELIDTICSVITKGREYPREDVIRDVANYLGFRRVTATVLKPIKSAINGAIRRSVLGYEGVDIWRNS